MCNYFTKILDSSKKKCHNNLKCLINMYVFFISAEHIYNLLLSDLTKDQK